MTNLLPRNRALTITLPILALLLCTACTRESRKSVHPTRGKVVQKKNMPAAGVLVIFTPVSEADPQKNWPNGFPRATTDKDGTFALTTYEPGDGIPVGEYAVTMLWTTENPGSEERAGADKLGGRFADPKKSTWKVTITEGVNEVPAFVVP